MNQALKTLLLIATAVMLILFAKALQSQSAIKEGKKTNTITLLKH